MAPRRGLFSIANTPMPYNFEVEKGEKVKKYDLLVVGAGLFGLTISQRAAEEGYSTLVIDKRSHIGGNAYSYFDRETGIEIHKYGAHLFHTKNEKVWKYVNRFSSFTNYRHHVFTLHEGRIYPMPINLGTINQYYSAAMSPKEAEKLVESKTEGAAKDAKNLEERAIALIGRDLYEAFIRDYTCKQWQTDPRDLPASIFTRLPIRFNYESSYFSDPYQGQPKEGFCSLFGAMIKDPKIEVRLECDYFEDPSLPKDLPTVYTGPIDRYFGYRYGVLGWRTIDFKEKRYDLRSFQGCSVLNKSDMTDPSTRSIEFKAFNPERKEVFESEKTVVWDEYSRFAGKEDEPYYPIGTQKDKEILSNYEALEKGEKNVIFGGRLGEYAYYNMDQTIASALDTFENKVLCMLRSGK